MNMGNVWKTLGQWLGRAPLDPDLHQSLVDSLYRPFGQIAFSTVISTGIGILAHERTGDAAYAWFALAFAVVGGIRFLLLCAYWATERRGHRMLSVDAWEFLAFGGAIGFALIVGSIAGYAAWDGTDPIAEILIVSTALSYVAGIAGRNVARRGIVIGQTCFACLPFLAGLIARADAAHLILASIVALNGILAISLCTGLARTIVERHRATKELTFMAKFDGLTRLLNRNGFLIQIGDTIAERAGSGRCWLLAVDLDRFKEVNDTYGHSAGDDLLYNVGQRIVTSIGAGDYAARIAGDEFHVVMVDSDKEDAVRTSELILESLRQPHQAQGQKISSAASLGLALAEHGDDINSLMVRADLALYKSKEQGRGRLTVFAEAIKREFEERKRLEEELALSLDTDEIFVAYQPIVDAETGQIDTCEALARWVHPEMGFVSPAVFIPTAERTGLINALGDKVLRRACSDAVAWGGAMKVAVNVSVSQFERGDLFALDVIRILGETGLPPHRLELEITESVLVTNSEGTLRTLTLLVEAGVRISLDDFGTGFSSLGYVKDFPFNKVKIDRSFASTALDNARSLAVIRAIRQMTRDLDIDLVVEGIETAEQLGCMLENDIRLIQGYLFSKPVPAEAIKGMLRTNPFVPMRKAG